MFILNIESTENTNRYYTLLPSKLNKQILAPKPYKNMENKYEYGLPFLKTRIVVYLTKQLKDNCKTRNCLYQMQLKKTQGSLTIELPTVDSHWIFLLVNDAIVDARKAD